MIQYISKPFKWFLKLEAASGLVLLFAAAIALIISNSDLSTYYEDILNTYFGIGIGNFKINLSVLHWVNDVLMTIFFFLVTLEIKREFIQGELSKPKQALLPIIAAVGAVMGAINGLKTTWLFSASFESCSTPSLEAPSVSWMA